jgi:hypothetical protein
LWGRALLRHRDLHEAAQDESQRDQNSSPVSHPRTPCPWWFLFVVDAFFGGTRMIWSDAIVLPLAIEVAVTVTLPISLMLAGAWYITLVGVWATSDPAPANSQRTPCRAESFERVAEIGMDFPDSSVCTEFGINRTETTGPLLHAITTKAVIKRQDIKVTREPLNLFFSSFANF